VVLGSFAVQFGDHLRSRDHLRRCTVLLFCLAEFIGIFILMLNMFRGRSNLPRFSKRHEQEKMEFGFERAVNSENQWLCQQISTAIYDHL